MISQARTCSTCHRELPPDAPKGCCPRCLYLVGLRAEEETPSSCEGEDLVPTDLAEFRGVQDFGDYIVLELIGRGGMGTVFKARQKSLNRIVALKLLALGPHPASEAVRRFRAEARATAALQHPNIVGIYEVGFGSPNHFIAMEYVPGQPLSSLVQGEPLPIREAARYLLIIARAVEYAHSQGILHRDLKPANVLIDMNGQPRVTDFGLAKRLDSMSDLTLTGHVLGSPSYMAPEQAGAQTTRLGRETDVYGLGAILYHCLTGRPPFTGAGFAETVQQLVSNDPVAPRLLNPGVPVDLQTICLKCLNKEPERRYPTAQAVAEELDRFLAGKPVIARPVGLAGQAWRWCCRKPALAGFGLALLLAVVGGFIGIVSQLQRARVAELAAQRAAYVANMNLAGQALAESNLGRTRALLQRYANKPEANLRGWEWRWLWSRTRSDERRAIHRAGSGIFTTVALSPDNRWLASVSTGEGLRLWRADSLRLIEVASNICVSADQVLFSSDGERLFAKATTLPALLSGSGSKGSADVEVLSFPALAPLQRLRHELPVRWMALSADSSLLATITDKEVRVWDTSQFNAVATFGHEHDLRYGKVAISPDGRRLAYSDFGGAIHIRDRVSNSELSSCIGHQRASPWMYSVLSLIFAPDGNHLLSAGADRTARCWDVHTGKQVSELVGHTAVVLCLAFSPDGATLASASGDQTIRLWDWPTLKNGTPLRGHTDEVWGLAFSSDGRLLVSSGKDESIRVWDLPRPKERQFSWAVPRDTRDVLLSADARRLGVLRRDGSFSLLDTTNWLEQLTRPLVVKPETNARVIIDPKAEWLAHSTPSGTINVWALPHPGTRESLAGHTGQVEALAFSANSRWLASVGSDWTVRLWDMTRRGSAGVFNYAGAVATRIAISANAEHVGLCLRDRQLLLLTPKTGHWRPGFVPHKMPYQVLFPEGQTFITAGYDGAVKLWDLRTLKCLQVLQGSLHGANSLAICPDQRTLAVGTGEGVIKLWNLELFQEVGTLKSHRGSVGQLALSADGQVLLSASEDAVCVWGAPSVGEIDRE